MKSGHLVYKTVVCYYEYNYLSPSVMEGGGGGHPATME